MNNCLKSQLKASVNNNKLPILGKLKIHVNVPVMDMSESHAQYVIGIARTPSEEITISLPEGKNIYSYDENYVPVSSLGNSVTYQAGVSIPRIGLHDSGEYDIIVTNKYNLTVINVLGEYELSEVKFIGTLESLFIKDGVTGSLSDISALSGLITLQCELTNNGVVGTTEDITAIANLSTLRIFRMPGLTGDIGVLGEKDLPINRMTFSSISGDVVDFVKNQVNIVGITSKELSWQGLGTNTNVKFNGHTITPSNNTKIVWEPAGAGQTHILLKINDVTTDEVTVSNS